MPYQDKLTRQISLLVLFLLLLPIPLRAVLPYTDNIFYHALSQLLIHMALCGALLIWIVSIRRRILYRTARISLIAMAGMMLLMLVIKMIKYRIAGSETVIRYLWYFFYLPFLFAPLFGLCAALSIDRADRSDSFSAEAGQKKLSPPIAACFLVSSLLFLLVCSNDYHQLVFGFLPDFRDSNSIYTHEPGYWITAAWIIGLILVQLSILLRRCRITLSRHLAWIPVLMILIGIFLSVLNFTTGFRPYPLPELCCIVYGAFWESLIQIGLTPSNTGYASLFARSGLDARILNLDGSVYFSSGASHEDGAEKRVSQAPIPGGYVQWTDSLTAVNRLRGELETLQSRLSEQYSLTMAENDLHERKRRAEEEAQLYRGIQDRIQPQLIKTAALLAEAGAGPDRAPRLIARATLYQTYIKRCSNLMLLSLQSDMLHASELYYCVRESLEALRFLGLDTDLSACPDCLIPAASAIDGYGVFQSFLEALDRDGFPISGLKATLTEGALILLLPEGREEIPL